MDTSQLVVTYYINSLLITFLLSTIRGIYILNEIILVDPDSTFITFVWSHVVRGGFIKSVLHLFLHFSSNL